MLEKTIEQFLVKQIEGKRGIAIKLNSTTMAGLPDRLILLPKGLMFFVEVKSTIGKLRLTQVVTHKILKNLGFKVYTVNSKKQIEEMLKEVIK